MPMCTAVNGSVCFACSIEPGLLLLPTDLLANRLAELRQAVPFGDVTELIYADPSLLLLDVRLLSTR